MTGCKVTRIDRPSELVNCSDMDFAKSSQSLVCSQSPNRNSFSIKNILSLRDERDVVEFPRLSGEGLENAKCAMPRPIVAPVPCAMSPPPLMYPCASFGLPLYGPPLSWPTIAMEHDITPWISNSHFIPRHEFFPGKYSCVSFVIKAFSSSSSVLKIVKGARKECE